MDVVCNSHYCGVCQIVIFYFHHFFYIYQWEFYPSRSCSFSLIYLFKCIQLRCIQLFTHRSMDSQIFFLGIVVHYYYYLFCCSNYPRLSSCKLLSVSPVSFQHAHIFMTSSSFCDIVRSYWLPLPQSWNQPFLQRALTPFLRTYTS